MLFGKRKSEKDELKDQISGLMGKYDKEEIDGATYANEMMNLSMNYKGKKGKRK